MVQPSDRQGDALAYLESALAWLRAQGIAVRAVLTDHDIVVILGVVPERLQLGGDREAQVSALDGDLGAEGCLCQVRSFTNR